MSSLSRDHAAQLENEMPGKRVAEIHREEFRCRLLEGDQRRFEAAAAGMTPVICFSSSSPRLDSLQTRYLATTRRVCELLYYVQAFGERCCPNNPYRPSFQFMQLRN